MKTMFGGTVALAADSCAAGEIPPNTSANSAGSRAGQTNFHFSGEYFNKTSPEIFGIGATRHRGCVVMLERATPIHRSATQIYDNLRLQNLVGEPIVAINVQQLNED